MRTRVKGMGKRYAGGGSPRQLCRCARRSEELPNLDLPPGDNSTDHFQLENRRRNDGMGEATSTVYLSTVHDRR